MRTIRVIMLFLLVGSLFGSCGIKRTYKVRIVTVNGDRIVSDLMTIETHDRGYVPGDTIHRSFTSTTNTWEIVADTLR